MRIIYSLARCAVARGLCLLALLIIGYPPLTARAQGTAFNYQGRIMENGAPASGLYDLQFGIYDSANAGTAVGGPTTNSAVLVTNGLFTVALDFGAGAFDGSARWLEIGVRTNGAGAFNILNPRQAILSTPYAIQSSNAITAQSAGTLSGTVAAAQVSGVFQASQIPNLDASKITGGTLSLSQLPSSVLTNGASGVNVSGNFSGNAAGLTNMSFNSLALPVVTNGAIAIAWGRNDNDITTVPPGLSNLTAVAASGHDLALQTNGTVIAWGYNAFGQANVPVGLSNVIAVAAGAQHSLALKSDGTVVAWGDNSHGQTNVPIGLSNVIAVTAGYYFSLALKSDGTIVGWGQTGVPDGLSNVIAVSGGAFHSLALLSDGTVVAWGDNSHGQLSVPAGLNNVTAVAAGYDHNLALRSDGTVWTWGNNNFGQVLVPNGLSNVTAIAAGYWHSVALKSDRTVVAWGFNAYGATSVPPGLGNVIALGRGSIASHVIVLQGLLHSAVPLLNVNNTFSGSNIVSGSFSGDGSGLINLNASQISSGTISLAQLPASIVTNNETGVTLSGAFSGNGSGLTNLNASQISAGTISLTQLPASVVTNSEAGVTLSGTFSGNGSGLTSLNAINLTNTINDARLSTNVALLNGSPMFSSQIMATGGIRMGDSNIWLRGGSDVNHGLGWYGNSKPFAGVSIDGPVLFGYAGGALGAAHPGSVTNLALQWDASQNVTVSGVLSGNGSGLTNLNAANLTNTVNDARLSSNVPLLNGANVFTGTNRVAGVAILTNANNQIAGTFTGNGAGLTNTATAANFVSAYDTTTQTAAVANTFQNITINSNGQINGWTHTAGTASFTNNQTGLYLVEYTAIAEVTASAPQTCSLRITLNGTEAAGTQSVTSITSNSQPVMMSKSAVVSVSSGSVLAFQFAGSSTAVALAAGQGSGTTKPSFSATIIRIQ